MDTRQSDARVCSFAHLITVPKPPKRNKRGEKLTSAVPFSSLPRKRKRRRNPYKRLDSFSFQKVLAFQTEICFLRPHRIVIHNSKTASMLLKRERKSTCESRVTRLRLTLRRRLLPGFAPSPSLPRRALPWLCCAPRLRGAGSREDVGVRTRSAHGAAPSSALRRESSTQVNSSRFPDTSSPTFYTSRNHTQGF